MRHRSRRSTPSANTGTFNLKKETMETSKTESILDFLDRWGMREDPKEQIFKLEDSFFTREEFDKLWDTDKTVICAILAALLKCSHATTRWQKDEPGFWACIIIMAASIIMSVIAIVQ